MTSREIRVIGLRVHTTWQAADCELAGFCNLLCSENLGNEWNSVSC